MEIRTEIALGIEKHRDDSHRFLRIIATVAECIARGRHKLRAAENIVRTVRGKSNKRPRYDQHQQQCCKAPESRCQYDAGDCLKYTVPYNGGDTRFRQTSTHQPADQGM